MENQSTPKNDAHENKFGQLVTLLIEDGHVTPKQADYGLRIQAKLETKKSLLNILVEDGHVDEGLINKILREQRVSLPIGKLLVELGHITDENLEKAILIQKDMEHKKKLGEILVDYRFIDEMKFIEILSFQLGFKYIDPEFADIDRSLFMRPPDKWYDKHDMIPINQENGSIVIAFGDPLDHNEMEAAKQIFGNQITPAIARSTSIAAAVKKHKKYKPSAKIEAGEDRSISGLVDSIITAAIDSDASDIHIEPLQDRLRIRMRQDGVLAHYKDLPREHIPAIVSRFKILCGADITEKRRHQGGRIFFEHAGDELDLRASFYITIHGEKIVLRLLNRQDELLSIEDLGMYPKMLERFKEDALHMPSGVILITGPTGSGKTSTVYSCITEINTPEISIVTAEEPVEYIMEGIAQCSINPKINLTFEETLRHIVRQDPDVIVIGEIRDNYSAEVAVQAALTGHKVMTTFHTEDSIGGLIRLLNMDIAPFLISSTVVCVAAQRLLRKICSACAEPYRPTPTIMHRLGYSHEDFKGARLSKGRGCSHCNYTGYKGRVGVFELLILNEAVRNAILGQKTSYEIRELSIRSADLVTLIEDGIVKAGQGITTVDEIIRCLPRLNKPRPYNELRRLSGI